MFVELFGIIVSVHLSFERAGFVYVIFIRLTLHFAYISISTVTIETTGYKCFLLETETERRKIEKSTLSLKIHFD